MRNKQELNNTNKMQLRKQAKETRQVQTYIFVLKAKKLSLKISFRKLPLPRVLILSKRSNFVVHTLVMGTERLGDSASSQTDTVQFC